MTQQTPSVLSGSQLILGIEMSNPSAAPADPHEQVQAVALWCRVGSQDELIGSAPMPGTKRGSDGIMLSIESLCAQCGVQPRDIRHILVSCGPGGYTALRIATTTAKMLASALDATVIAVPTAYVAASSIAPTDRPALVALASKKDHTHATYVDTSGACKEIGIISGSDLAGLGIKSIFADTHLPASIAQQARALGIALQPLRLDARALHAGSAGLHPTDPVQLSPRYAREPDAVTQWRQRASE